jgi:hypothetical protein
MGTLFGKSAKDSMSSLSEDFFYQEYLTLCKINFTFGKNIFTIMKTFSLLHVPMLDRKWRKFALLFFPVSVLFAIATAILRTGIDPDQAAEIIYLGWACGLTLLNLSKEKVEDEMIKTFRLQAFQTGFFWLMCGLVAILIVNYLRFRSFHPEAISAGMVLFLLNLYVWAAFEFQKWRSNEQNPS